MPLPERLIQPVAVSRGTLQCTVPDELEGVTNGTLANVIRQLSSLSRHAEEMFGNLFSEAETLATRGANLQARIDKLAVQVTRLDSTVEEVSLQDIHLRKVFRSSQAFDQQVVSRDTMPKAMLEAYLACDKPPPLDKLNPYREDGKDGLKFYTDPNYFFELWRQEMLKDTERMMHDRGKKPNKANQHGNINGQKGDRNKKRLRQPHNTAERHRQKAMGQGEYLLRTEYEQQYGQDPAGVGAAGNISRTSGIIGYDPALASPPNNQPRPNSIEIKRTYQGYQYNVNQEPIYTPRILRSEQPPSPQRQQYQQQQQYVPYMEQQQPGPVDVVSQVDAMVDAYSGELGSVMAQMSNLGGGGGGGGGVGVGGGGGGGGGGLGSNGGTPTRRPNEPPPAPPLEQQQLNNRDSLPPPPPPPPVSESEQNGGNSYSMQHQNHKSSPMHQKLMSQLNSHHQEMSKLYNSGAGDNLPPPPPVPTTTTSASPGNNGLMMARVPPEHLPPSPPPPPLEQNGVRNDTNQQIPATSASNNPSAMAPPPPPPPPLSSTDLNGEVNGGIQPQQQQGDKSITSPTSQKNGGSPPKSALSPQGMKKQPVHKHHVQDGIRSDLLKAIRDGIALRKVEEKKQAAAKGGEDDRSSALGGGSGGAGQSDVASILARRVAVEMSDSDDERADNAPSDSEYDSDEWGDESQA